MHLKIKTSTMGKRNVYVVDLRSVDGVAPFLKKYHRFSTEDQACEFVDKVKSNNHYDTGTMLAAKAGCETTLFEQAEGGSIRWKYFEDLAHMFTQLCRLDYEDVDGKKTKFGNVLCQHVLTVDIEEQIVPQLIALDYEYNSIRHRIKALKKLFDYASRKKWCGSQNVASSVKIPREKYKGEAEAEKTEIERYSIKEINKVVDFAMAKDKPWISQRTGNVLCPQWCNGLAVKFAAFTGFRFSEVAGLKWKYVHLDEGYVRCQLSQRLEPVRSGKDQKSVRTLLLDAPKNTKSHGKAPAALRNVFLIPELAQDLREWRLRSPRSDDNDLVFITRGSDCKGTKPGRVLTATNWRRDFLTPACIAAEIKPITWHDLRHFFATIAFERFPENYVRVTELLGHEQIQTTLDHYKGWHDKTGRMKEDGAAFQQILQR